MLYLIELDILEQLFWCPCSEQVKRLFVPIGVIILTKLMHWFVLFSFYTL